MALALLLSLAVPLVVGARGQTRVIAWDAVRPYLVWAPAVVLAGVLVYLLRSPLRAAVGLPADHQRVPVRAPATRFADVAGCPEAVADLAEIADLLRDPQRWHGTGARVPRGYLLAGPPGTGKTLLARAVAGEAGVPFFATSGADFNDTFMGVGRRRVRTLFARARKAAATHGGAVVFVDELDALGGARSAARRDSASDDHDATLVALLTELDGFATHGSGGAQRHGVVVLAATNRPNALDAALTRPGRFDRRITVAAPDPAGRAEILRIHAAHLALAADVDLAELGRRTPGLVGADLEGLVNEAALEAARRGTPAVDAGCFEEALATTMMGRARTGAVVGDRDRRITAWHEAGHTVVALVEPDADDPVSVSITPRGVAGGVTWMSGSDAVFLTVDQAHARLAVAMGGRAAEELLLDGSFSQGASSDLDAATRLAASMAAEYGMTRLGLARRPLVEGAPLPDDVLVVVEEVLAAALDRARAVLRSHRWLLEEVAAELLDRESLDRPALERICLEAVCHGEGPVPAARSRSAHLTAAIPVVV